MANREHIFLTILRRNDRGMSIKELCDYEEFITGERRDVSSAKSSVNRLVKEGKIMRFGHGLYMMI